MRALVYGGLITLYILSGRWAFSRLFIQNYGEKPAGYDFLPLDAEWFSLSELRFLLTIAFVVAAMLERRRSGSMKRSAATFAAALTAFFFYLILSTLWTPDLAFGAIKAIEAMMIVVPCAVIYQIVTGPHGPAARRWMWRMLYGFTALMSVAALVKAVQYGPERLAVLGGGPNVFGRMMGFLILGALMYWRRGGKWGWVHVGAATLGLLLIVLSGSRGCLIAALGAIAAFFVVERIEAGKLLMILIGGALMMSAVVAFTDVGRKALETYEERVERLLIKERYTSGRDTLYHDAWEMGLRYPVFGGGLASFRGLRYGVYPHNMFLELFCEEGAVGVGLFLIVLWRFERIYWNIRATADGATMAAFVLMLLNAQVSGDMYDSRAIFVFMMLAFLPKDPLPAPRRKTAAAGVPA